jgi:phage antirepressor YoqD-like protein
MTTTRTAADEARRKSRLELAELVADGAMKITDAVKFTGIGRTKLFALLKEHGIVSWKEGNTRVVPRRELQRLLRERLEAAQAEERGEAH